MNQTSSDYIRSHGLVRKYGWGLAMIAFAGTASALNGDTASLLTLKMLIAIPFAICVTWLPVIFDPVRSRQPFTPSFIERSVLEGILIALAINIASWSPDFTPLRLIVPVIITTLFYVGIRSVAYTVIQGNKRQ